MDLVIIDNNRVFFYNILSKGGMRMRVIIERFEDSYAVVELPNHNLAVIPRQVIDSEAKVGDVLEIRVDHRATISKSSNALDFLDHHI